MKAPTTLTPVGGILWQQQNPGVFNTTAFLSARAALQLERITRLSGADVEVGMTFQWELLDCFVSPHSCTMQETIEGITNFLNAAAATKTPVSITLDPIQFWYQSNLWNWFDPSQPGYDPANVGNVEWTGAGPAYATKIAWRDWGSQFRMPTPQPNLGSPALIALVQSQLEQVLAAVRSWYNSASPSDSGLLRGIKIAEEIDVGANFYFYPNGNTIYDTWPNTSEHDPTYGLNFAKGMWGGLVPMGFAMRNSTTGSSGGPAPNGTEIGRGIKAFVEAIAATVRSAWPEKAILSEHFFSLHLGHAGDGFIPWNSVMVEPFLPAYSVYPGGRSAPPEIQTSFVKDLHSYMSSNRAMVVGEWFCFGCQDKEDWKAAFFNLFHDFEAKAGCTVEEVRVYNLDSFVRANGAVDGLHEFLSSQKDFALSG